MQFVAKKNSVSVVVGKVVETWYVSQTSGCLSMQYTGRRLCGTLKPRAFYAESTLVRIIFRSDHVLEKSGFFLSWKTEGIDFW